MDNFKDFLRTSRDKYNKSDIKKTDKVTVVESVDSVGETIQTQPKIKNSEDKLSKSNHLLEQVLPTFSSQTLRSGYIGSFNYIPNPNEVSEGAEYRNTLDGTVYKKVGNLWEEYIKDGRNGRDGRSTLPGGGCGPQEVKSLISKQASARLYVIEGATATSVSATQANLISFDASYDFNIVGLKVEGPDTGTYTAVVRFYTFESNTFKLAATSVITNANNVDGILFLSENKQWCADIQVTAGTVPSPGITAKVVL